MPTTIVLNPKGGCGKSTIATNLAGYYAARGKRVVLADFDPQGSSMDWAAERPPHRAPVKTVAAWKDSSRLSRAADQVIIDSPAGLRGRALSNLLRRADAVIIPMLASPLDMRAAAHFLDELAHSKPVGKLRVATVANRIRDNTIAAWELEEYLEDLKLAPRRKVPLIASLRQSQNYLRAADRGLSIFEFAPYATQIDRDQWKPLIRWLNRGA